MQLFEILHIEGHTNRITGSRVTAILLNDLDFACWWGCIGKGLRLQPAQQAWSFTKQYISTVLFYVWVKFEII